MIVEIPPISLRELPLAGVISCSSEVTLLSLLSTCSDLAVAEICVCEAQAVHAAVWRSLGRARVHSPTAQAPASAHTTHRCIEHT